MSDTPAIDAVLARIRSYRQSNDISYSRLALDAGLSRAALLGMDAEGWSPTSDTVRALERIIPADWQPERPQQSEGQSA